MDAQELARYKSEMAHQGRGYILHHHGLSGLTNNAGKIQGANVPCQAVQQDMNTGE